MNPEIFIVGAHKSGTTTLYETLSSHPDVFACETKEPHFFVSEKIGSTVATLVHSRKEYSDLYENKGDCQAIDASVLYLHFAEQAARGIFEAVGDTAKIVVCLREPVGRAYSAYLDVSRHNELENLSFRDALLAEPRRKQNGDIPATMLYRSLGLYTEGCRTFLETFSNVHFILFEELVASPEVELRKLCDFLAIDADRIDQLMSSNRGGTTWAHPRLGKVIKHVFNRRFRATIRGIFPGLYLRAVIQAKDRLFGEAQGLDLETSLMPELDFSEDRRKLESLLGRSLDIWGSRQRPSVQVSTRNALGS